MAITLDLRKNLGELKRLREDPLGTLLDWGRKHPRYALPLPRTPLFLIFDPEGVERILHGTDNKATFQYRELSRLTGKGLLTDWGEEYQRVRKALKDPFLPKSVAAYGEALEEEAEAFFTSWRVGEKRELDHEMLALSLRFLGRILWGRLLPERIATSTLSALEHIVERMRNPLSRLNPLAERRFQRSRRVLLQEAAELIYEPPFHILSRERALAEAITLLVAGHETTASALTWSLYLLSREPAWQQKIAQSETHALMAFQEALRLYPPAWIITRKAETALDLGNETIPKGSTVVLCPYVTHRLYFPEGEIFRPERFLEAKSLPNGRYFPFGMGKRTCLGRNLALLEGIVALRAFFQRFRLPPLPEPQVQAGVTLRPKGGLWVTLEKA
ncbi:cytochrome [Thermus scotoductus]|uniref:Cytochrome n=2 Tax=Thermus TaxID=270 RepID=A0A430SDX0_THESC|nr:cytochrome P450 [Thermus scotoductus]RTG98033.1 cytochrome [Thermus scotoductus]RTH13129.1 cytochrome [Thermus scotoductus]RTH13942.1 cytochrome [Thermus scotoductus]RTH15044.1 cytochrome [Thermus scotoductus]RTH20108.1 cytochrome [Thermus scotoductus]